MKRIVSLLLGEDATEIRGGIRGLERSGTGVFKQAEYRRGDTSPLSNLLLIQATSARHSVAALLPLHMLH